ncbi:MAG TPA: 3-oxoacyl-[acyl-carrier-protein] synthase III C-terminal domain-containing protein, partial [Blastococcus sp.]|nr:3-oxoacyl-[acyl-carrier-protein] synthase III C-terminal domain-containing protein [Blastococcus sp.]
QANKTMVIQLAERAGLTADQLYFNIEKVGNTSSASIPLAIHDAVRDGAISEPLRVFAPGFGAGAVAGYAVLRIDPAVVAVQLPGKRGTGEVQPDMPAQPERPPASEEMQTAFG